MAIWSQGSECPRWRASARKAHLTVAGPGDITTVLLVTDYWRCRGGALATEALKLAALPPSGADIERIFSQRRAAFDYFMGKLKVETLSDRCSRRSTRSCSACLPASCSAAGRPCPGLKAEGRTGVTSQCVCVAGLAMRTHCRRASPTPRRQRASSCRCDWSLTRVRPMTGLTPGS
jgi:hypothetical protein